jgi:hypothetical protein
MGKKAKKAAVDDYWESEEFEKDKQALEETADDSQSMPTDSADAVASQSVKVDGHDDNDEDGDGGGLMAIMKKQKSKSKTKKAKQEEPQLQQAEATEDSKSACLDPARIFTVCFQTRLEMGV